MPAPAATPRRLRQAPTPRASGCLGWAPRCCPTPQRREPAAACPALPCPRRETRPQAPYGTGQPPLPVPPAKKSPGFRFAPFGPRVAQLLAQVQARSAENRGCRVGIAGVLEIPRISPHSHQLRSVRPPGDTTRRPHAGAHHRNPEFGWGQNSRIPHCFRGFQVLADPLQSLWTAQSHKILSAGRAQRRFSAFPSGRGIARPASPPRARAIPPP